MKDINEMKAKYFLDSKGKVHIETKGDRFYNGVITEVTDSIFIINDRFIGDIPVWFSELKKIEPYKEEGK